MMRMFGLIAFVSLAATAHGQANPLTLHIQPDIQSREIARVALQDPRLGQPAPVLDEAKAALGWNFAEFTDQVEGYVPDAKIGKDLLPVDSTIIRSTPGPNEPVLGVYRTGQAIEVIDTGDWWKIRTRMAFPVYFVLDSPAPLPAVIGLAETAPAEPDSPRIIEAPVTDTDAPEPSSGSAPSRAEQAAPPPQPDIIGQSYEGTFRRAKKVLGLFAPKATFFLEQADGRRIAWIDTSGLVIPGSLKAYLDKPVIVYGDRDYMAASREWIIRARTMRLK